MVIQTQKLSDIQLAESFLGLLVPDDYKNWLKNNKDFEPDDYALTYIDPQHGRECVTGLGEFYTFSPDENTQYPKNVEPFHVDEHGIQYCLDYRNNPDNPDVIEWVFDKRCEFLKNYYGVKHLLQENLIPFANNGGGYFFCFDYRKNVKNPEVVLWIRDNPDETCIAKLADNFTEFLSKLKVYEDPFVLESIKKS